MKNPLDEVLAGELVREGARARFSRLLRELRQIAATFPDLDLENMMTEESQQYPLLVTHNGNGRNGLLGMKRGPYKQRKLHWTQDPKNKAKLLKVRRAGAAALRAKRARAEQPIQKLLRKQLAKRSGQGIPKNGVHWTQRPENREKLRLNALRSAKVRRQREREAASA